MQIRFHQQSVLNMLQNSNNVASSKKLHATRVSQLPSNWLLFDEMTSMEHLALIRCCTVISPITAILFAGQSRLPADAMKTEVQGDDCMSFAIFCRYSIDLIQQILVVLFVHCICICHCCVVSRWQYL